MRAVLLAIALLGLASSAWAERVVADPPRIRAARSFGYGDDPPNTIVPANPSMFIYADYGGSQELPVFSTATGTPIAIRGVTYIPTAPWLKRVDLDIAEGQIIVRLPGRTTPLATYVVDPAFHPKTHLVDVKLNVLRVDSDAVAFRDVHCDHNCIEFNDGLVSLDHERAQRILALYPDGSEAVIYETSGTGQFTPQIRLRAMDLSPLPATLLLLLVLGVIGVLASRTD